MRSILILLTLSIIINIQTSAQRDRQGNGRGQESGHIERIDRNQDENMRNIKHQRTVEHYQVITPETIPIQTDVSVIIEKHQPGYCIVKYPDQYNFPDRIYQLPNIEFILQKFSEEDFEWIIYYLNDAIEESPFVPELYYLRGVAYINRKSDDKRSDYWAAKNDFEMVKTLDPKFSGLDRYFEILDFRLWGIPIMSPR